MESFVLEKGANWFDLNLAKKEYLPLTDEDFYDVDHLNIQGNEKVTAFLKQYLKAPEDKYFYETLEEKREEEKIERILAVEYEKTYMNKDGETIEWFSSEDDLLKYRLTVVEEGIGDVYYKIYPVYEVGAEEPIYGEMIPYQEVEPNVIEIELSYKQESTRLMVEVYDKETDECIYRVKS